VPDGLADLIGRFSEGPVEKMIAPWHAGFNAARIMPGLAGQMMQF
jgi:hypothetical protein